MSYILDALKRSDQDHYKGDVPNLHSQPDELVPAAAVTSKYSRKNLVLAFLLPLLAGLLVWVLLKSMIIDTSRPSTPVTTATPDINPSFDASSMNENITPQQDNLFLDEDYLDELKDVRLDVSPVDEAEVPVSKNSTVEKPTAQSADALVAASNERAVESETQPEPTQPASEANKRTISTESSHDPDPYQEIPHQRQLPYDLQNALPDMIISVHMYSAEPSSRFVRINNSIYQEGERIDTELKLEEITRDGLIMTFRDNRFWRYVR